MQRVVRNEMTVKCARVVRKKLVERFGVPFHTLHYDDDPRGYAVCCEHTAAPGAERFAEGIDPTATELILA